MTEREREYQRQYHVVHREKKNAVSRAWHAANREKANERRRRRRKNDYKPEYFRERHLRKAYGLTVAQYEAMLAAQGGRCAICGTDKPGPKKRAWHIDHDHATGKVRALLCAGCNVKVGAAESTVFAKVLEYLAKHSTSEAA